MAQKLLLFSKWEAIQHGTHAELVADVNGKYHDFWNTQAQYYTEKTA